MKAFIIAVLLLLLSAQVLAYTDDAGDGMTVYSITADELSWWERLIGGDSLAIVLTKTVYAPGETITATIGSCIPYNTQQAILTIKSLSGGAATYYKDVTSLIYPATCSNVKITFSAPQTVGDYEIAATYNDGGGRALYTDKTFFRVATGTVTCPANYCTSWTSVEQLEKGVLQQKTCYTHGPAPECKPTAAQSYRTVCDSGYIWDDTVDRCVLPGGAATCGDGVKQSTEQCDLGNNNGVCPSSCNAVCQLSNCQLIPNETPEGEEQPPADEGVSGWKVGAGIASILAAVGLLIWRFA